MAHEMRLDLKVTGINRYYQAADAIERLARAQRNLNNSGGSNMQVPAGNNAPVPASAPASPAAPPKLPVPKGGPHSRLQGAMQNMQVALASGDPIAIADAQHHIQRAQSAVQRASGGVQGSFASRLNTFIRSTRFGAGGGLGGMNPLVGRTMDLLGVGSLASPIGLVAGAMTTLYSATKMAAGVLLSFGKDMATGGGTAGQSRAARIIGGATGVDIFGLSRRLQKDYYSDPLIGMHLRRYGYSAPGIGMARDTNAVGPALRALLEMARKGDLRGLQDVGAEGLYGMRYLSRAEQERWLQTQQSMFSPDKQADAMRFNLAMQELQQSFQELATSMTPLIKFFTALSQSVNDMLTEKNPGRIAFNTLFPMAGLSGYMGERMAQNWADEKRAKEEGKVASNIDALDRNTRSNERLANSLDDMTQQLKGGGQRAKNAIPEAWRYGMLDEVAKKEAIALGAFT